MATPKDPMMLGMEALNEYLKYLGITVVTWNQSINYDPMYTIGQPTSIGHYSYSPAVYTIECTCKENIYNYVAKHSMLLGKIVTPIVNKDALFGGYFQPNGAAIESIFTEEVTYKFDIVIRASSLADLDRWILSFKKDTEDLRIKRFNEAMDKQITEELSKED